MTFVLSTEMQKNIFIETTEKSGSTRWEEEHLIKGKNCIINLTTSCTVYASKHRFCMEYNIRY